MKEMGKVLFVMTFLMTLWFSSKSLVESREQSKKVLIVLRIVKEEDIEKRSERYIFWGNRIRKIAHFVLFGVVGASAYLITGNLVKSIGITLVMGCMDEIHQHFTPGRGPQLSDVLIDIRGGTLGAVIAKGIIKVRDKSREAKKIED